MESSERVTWAAFTQSFWVKSRAKLTGISDPVDAARANAAELFAVPIYDDYRKMLPTIDAAIIAAPTDAHCEIAKDLLRAGKHLLVEKPLAANSHDASQMSMLAASRRLILQVGHVERFNPAFAALEGIGVDVKYIEAVRASRFPGRCLDVGVVMDLMIHDIDLVLSMTEAPMKSVAGSGLSVISDHEDLAEARVEFECGLVANLKASRVSPEPARNMQVFGSGGFADINFGAPSLSVVRPCDSVVNRSFDLSLETDDPLGYSEQLFSTRLKCETIELEPRNAILDELHDFVISIQTGVSPTVDGNAGARAVQIADQILEAIETRQWYSDAKDTEIGPQAYVRERIESASRRIHDGRKAA